MDSITSFLLEYPPLDEIGGPVTEIIEKYRNGVMSKKEAVNVMNMQFKSFLTKYSERQKELAHQLALQYGL
jgi:hypothetical protein